MASSEPVPVRPDPEWDHYQLYQRVRSTLYAVPVHFSSGTVIDGLLATDLQTLNQVVGATIEEQVVATLNQMRPIWDPEGRYLQYSFRRQAQVFPDVLLMSEDNGRDVILGIELKGWYLLAKERMPNFRFTVTPAACAPADLLVVVPWALDRILSGQPITLKPFVVGARDVASYRNHWWSELRAAQGKREVHPPEEAVAPYPTKGNTIVDKPEQDGGGNFGRLARTGRMADYIQEMLEVPLAGVPVEHWLRFLRQIPQ